MALLANVVQPEALDGLEQFSHVWLIYAFHENTNAAKQRQRHQVRAKVHPPALGGESIGLFATRTPHRPNAIGLSVVRLLEVRGNLLVLGGADIVDGTPILDVKPYLKHDLQPEARVPAWCEEKLAASLIREVRFSARALEELQAATPSLAFYTDSETVRVAIEQVLQLDIRSIHQGRGQRGDGQQAYTLRLDRLELQFATFESHVEVTCVNVVAAATPSAAPSTARAAQ